MKIKINKFNSFQEEEKAEIEYWRNASPKEKIQTFEAICYITHKLQHNQKISVERVVRIKNLHEKEQD